jgi:hypothetical protein
MFVAYVLGMANLIDQIEVLEAGLRLEADGLAGDLRVRFADGSSVARFLSAQVPRTPAIPEVEAARTTSVTTLDLDPKSRAAAVLEATRFFLENAPRPQPLPEPSKRRVAEAVRTFMASLGPRITLLSAVPRPGRGLVSDVSVYQVTDPAGFRDGIQKMAAAWEDLADQLRFYLKIETIAGKEDVDGVPVTVYVPRMRFGIPARHARFLKRMEALYGEGGLRYRVAVTGGHAVVGTGSDPALFRRTVRAVREGKRPEADSAVVRLQKHLPARQNVSFLASLPLALKQSLIQGGTDPDRIGTVDPGSERAGLGMVFGGSAISIGSYWPHEQLRLARELLERVAPELTEAPESLFEPPGEGPPAGKGPPPVIPPEPPPAPPENAPAPEPPPPPEAPGPEAPPAP